AARKQVGLG
ncbi:hypothetical protein D046_1826B, partial [Vibrio parahaemolyticus V-223/04]